MAQQKSMADMTPVELDAEIARLQAVVSGGGGATAAPPSTPPATASPSTPDTFDLPSMGAGAGRKMGELASGLLTPSGLALGGGLAAVSRFIPQARLPMAIGGAALGAFDAVKELRNKDLPIDERLGRAGTSLALGALGPLGVKRFGRALPTGPLAKGSGAQVGIPPAAPTLPPQINFRTTTPFQPHPAVEALSMRSPATMTPPARAQMTDPRAIGMVDAKGAPVLEAAPPPPPTPKAAPTPVAIEGLPAVPPPVKAAPAAPAKAATASVMETPTVTPELPPAVPPLKPEVLEAFAKAKDSNVGMAQKWFAAQALAVKEGITQEEALARLAQMGQTETPRFANLLAEFKKEATDWVAQQKIATPVEAGPTKLVNSPKPKPATGNAPATATTPATAPVAEAAAGPLSPLEAKRLAELKALHRKLPSLPPELVAEHNALVKRALAHPDSAEMVKGGRLPAQVAKAVDASMKPQLKPKPVASHPQKKE